MLQGIVGHYFLYVEDEGRADDVTTMHEDILKRMVVDNFGRQRSAFVDSLQCEDYEEDGILKLGQVSEAIVSTDEEVEGKVLDYMLYYVFARSQSADRMEYKTLIGMLDEQLQARERAQSAQRKTRPESSSPEKIKARNPGKQQAPAGDPSSSDAENNGLENNLDLDDYSDDPDLGVGAGAGPDAAGEKPTSGAAAAPQADKKSDEDYSEDEEGEYLAEYDRVKQQQAAQEKVPQDNE